MCKAPRSIATTLRPFWPCHGCAASPHRGHGAGPATTLLLPSWGRAHRAQRWLGSTGENKSPRPPGAHRSTARPFLGEPAGTSESPQMRLGSHHGRVLHPWVRTQHPWAPRGDGGAGLQPPARAQRRNALQPPGVYSRPGGWRVVRSRAGAAGPCLGKGFPAPSLPHLLPTSLAGAGDREGAD